MKTLKLSEHIWIKACFFIPILSVIGITLYGLKIFILPIIAGLILAVILEPVVGRLERKGTPRIYGTGLVVGTLFIIILAFTAFLLPKVIDELHGLNDNKEMYSDLAQIKYITFKNQLEDSFPNKVPWPYIDNRLEQYKTSSQGKINGYTEEIAANSINIFFNCLIIPIIAFFVLKDGIAFKKWFIQFVPNRYFELAMSLFHNIKHQIGQFLRGQLLDCLIIGSLVTTLLGFIGMPFFFAIGLFSTVANSVPFLGPTASCLLSLLVTSFASGPSPLAVVGVFAAANLIDMTFIYPATVGQKLNLHPIAVILGVMIGGHIGGIVGMIVIIPIISILKHSIEIMFKLLRGYSII